MGVGGIHAGYGRRSSEPSGNSLPCTQSEQGCCREDVDMNVVARPLLAALLALAGTCLAQAQGWPERPIKFISSQSAGGGTDVIGRLVADQLAGKVGQPIVYENRPGGGNVIGTQAAARSAPDGYTFFFASAAALVTDPHTYKSLPYDPMKDFEVASNNAEVTFMLAAHPGVRA